MITSDTSAAPAQRAWSSLEVNEHVFRANVGDKAYTLRAGKLAGLAGGAVTVQVGETVVLVTATASKEPRSHVNFLPLSVDVEEKLYAAGRIPGSFFRREGRASEVAILAARLIDRPLRPLFPKGCRNEIQIISTALSSDGQNYIDIPSLVGASAALMISDVPFPEPVGGVRIALVDGEFIVNPTADEMEGSVLDLRIAATEKAILMVECGALEVDEDTMIRAIQHAHAAMQPIIALQHEMRAALGKEKRVFPLAEEDHSLDEAVRAFVGMRIDQAFDGTDNKTDQNTAVDAIQAEWVAKYAVDEDSGEEPEFPMSTVTGAFSAYRKERVRRRILDQGIRPDGRKTDQIRPLYTEVDILPRTHGSGIFQRGETQVLATATLGTLGEEQRLDTLRPEGTKRYMHHYNFPPFSTGETWFLRGPKRREIGHGALSETAVSAVLPSEDDFPYAIRVVSECLSSNGSTSMASVCASTLSLMDAGVPLKAPVAGIAMGLISDDEDTYQVLTDIQGMEDHLGDMDFKVAGTAAGITALQMDIKLGGLSEKILREALAQAREARLQLLDHMLSTLSQPRAELSKYAPRIVSIKIDPESIGKLIGPGGKTIRAIQDQTGVKIDVQDDGTVHVASVEGAEGANMAMSMIEGLTASPELGKTYTGTVSRIVDFGAFVEILPGQDGLVHISQLAEERVPSVADVLSVGDEILVMVTDISDGKVRLSRSAVLKGLSLEEARAADAGLGSRGGGGGGGGRDRRSGGDRGRGGRR